LQSQKVEKDSDPANAGQIQALGMGPELGYISIPELLEVDAEFDFHYAHQTVAEILNAALHKKIGGPHRSAFFARRSLEAGSTCLTTMIQLKSFNAMKRGLDRYRAPA
jgi:hypothetical protein